MEEIDTYVYRPSKLSIIRFKEDYLADLDAVYEKLAEGRVVLMDLDKLSEEDKAKTKRQLKHVCAFAQVELEEVLSYAIIIDPKKKKNE